MFPIYQGSYERSFGQMLNWYKEPHATTEWVIHVCKDMCRSIDYLETRPDIDKGRIAYYGVAVGGIWGPMALAVENRFKAGILLSAGLSTNRASATTPAIDCSGLREVHLSFQRWLGVESASFDHAGIQVSNDGVKWDDVWVHSGGAIVDGEWSGQEYDISATADRESTVYIRWAMGPTDASLTYTGWNIDDVVVSGRLAGEPHVAYEANMDVDPGWTFDAGSPPYQWEWGPPGGALPAFIHCDIEGSGGSGAGWDASMGTDGGGNIDL